MTGTADGREGARTGRTAVLVGGTSGLGRALASELASRGWTVVATGRTTESTAAVDAPAAGSLGAIHGRVLPLEEPLSAVSDLERTLVDLPPMELFVWIAGVMPSEAAWPEMREAALAAIPVNLGAAAVLLSWAAERMEARGRGRLAGVGSVAGDRGRKGAPVYGASKAGLHALLDGLRHRLHGTGVGVTTIRPGWMATRMLPADLAASPLTVPVDRAARIVADGLERGRDLFYVGWWWRCVGGVLRLLPTWAHKRFAPK